MPEKWAMPYSYDKDEPAPEPVASATPIGQNFRDLLDYFNIVVPPRPWLREAACRDMSPDLFFPARGDWATVKKAVEVCQSCPVRAQCLEAHLGEREGVWGGMSGNERKAERRRRALKKTGKEVAA